MSEPHPYEDDLNRSYQVGIYAGLGQASGFLLNLAVEAFKNGEPEAGRFKRIADELSRMSEKAHPGVK